jgi:aminopeptidase
VRGVDDATLDALADLLVGFGANVQAGQIVALDAELGKEDMARRVAASAYRHGARFVDVQYFDPWIKRARIEHAAEDTLDYVPPWLGARVRALGEHRAARIRLEGSVAPGLLDDLDPARVGRDQLPRLAESIEVVSERTTNWTIGPVPTEAWARTVFPDQPGHEALAALWRDVVHMLRLDEPDPVAAWRARQDELVGAADRLTTRRFDAIRLHGAGTDLTVGLFASSRWISARFETVDGIVHAPNLPSEEVFTTPDPARVDGVVTATRPLSLNGAIVRGLRVRFEAGRVAEMSADSGGEALAGLTAKDEGASRLGELALVDASGRVGPLGRTFYDTLLDENAASHIALGAAYRFAVEDEEEAARANRSAVHIDFMIGSAEIAVDGLEADGTVVPVLRAGRWQL